MTRHPSTLPATAPRRVAFVNTHPIQYHAGWFRALAGDSRFDVEVLYCHNPAPAEQGDAGFGVAFGWDLPLLDGYRCRFLRNVSPAPSTQTFFGLDTPELATLIRSGRYDAVITNGWHYKSAWQAIGASWRAGVPVFVRSDSHLHTQRSTPKQLLKSLPYRAFISRLDGCLPVGRWSADYFRHYGAHESRVHIVPHAVDRMFEHEATRLAPRRTEYRLKWGLDPEDTVFLFAGKFIDQKRPLDFLRAIARARERNPRIAALMVGDGPLRSMCETAVREMGTRVRFTGFLNQSQIVPSYLAADALVLPSDGETWGLVVNEAMTCGRPALVTDRVGCGPDLIRNGETGFVFRFGDVEALSALLLDLASVPHRLRSMGEKAATVIRNYSVQAAVEAMAEALTRTTSVKS